MESAELTEKLQGLFTAKGKKVSVSESCTGGLIGHLITLRPGASDYFDSSVVAYSAQSKKKLLGLGGKVLEKHGPVSEEVSRAMAEAVRDRTGTDFGLAITGNLGPTAVKDERVGLVYIAVAFDGGTESRGFLFEGQRGEIKDQAALKALEVLFEVASIWA